MIRKASTRPGNQRQTGWVYRGITQHALMLGVTRVHLWLVLTGRRESLPLLRRYRELLATMPHATRPYPARAKNRRAA